MDSPLFPDYLRHIVAVNEVAFWLRLVWSGLLPVTLVLFTHVPSFGSGARDMLFRTIAVMAGSSGLVQLAAWIMAKRVHMSHFPAWAEYLELTTRCLLPLLMFVGGRVRHWRWLVLLFVAAVVLGGLVGRFLPDRTNALTGIPHYDLGPLFAAISLIYGVVMHLHEDRKVRGKEDLRIR